MPVLGHHSPAGQTWQDLVLPVADDHVPGRQGCGGRAIDGQEAPGRH